MYKKKYITVIQKAVQNNKNLTVFLECGISYYPYNHKLLTIPNNFGQVSGFFKSHSAQVCELTTTP